MGMRSRTRRLFAAWGIDYLKYDWCGAGDSIHATMNMQRLYQKMGDALRARGPSDGVQPMPVRPRRTCGSGVRRSAANLWRTTGDIRDTWDR